MLRRWLIIFPFLLLFVSGCSRNIALSRSAGPFEPVLQEGLYDREFSGELSLVYEKKIQGSANSPLILGEKYIAFNTTRDRLLILKKENGGRAGRIRKGKGLILEPLVFDSLAVIVKRSPLGQVQVINLFKGKVISQRTINQIRSGPIRVEKTLIFGMTSGIMALSLPELDVAWQNKSEGIVDPAPAAKGKNIYYAAGGDRLVSARMENGEVNWSINLESDIVSKLTVGRYIYLGTADGTVVAIDAEKGNYAWKQSVGFPIRGAIVRTEDHIYFGCNDGKIYCLDAENGVKAWDFQTEGIVTATPVIHGRMLLVGSQDRHLYSLDAATGRLVDKHQLEGPITQPVVVDGNRIFAACGDSRIYCFEAKDEGEN